jgi:hypothetical protein
VKKADPSHIVTHANWTITRDLNLEFFDVASFNVYPLWPPEVAALGYGPYLREKIQPIAADKPLLLTEFGVSSLEAGNEGQGTIIQRSWQGLKDAGACGGIVFEFADQWWKNYDNPRRPQNYWDRVPAPDDEAAHDADPEENYGLFTSDRKEKPAASAVRQMFRSDERHWWSSVATPYLVVVTFIALALLACVLPILRLRKTRRTLSFGSTDR